MVNRLVAARAGDDGLVAAARVARALRPEQIALLQALTRGDVENARQAVAHVAHHHVQPVHARSKGNGFLIHRRPVLLLLQKLGRRVHGDRVLKYVCDPARHGGDASIHIDHGLLD